MPRARCILCLGDRILPGPNRSVVTKLSVLSIRSLQCNTYLSLLMIDHDIVRLDVPVHDAFAMAEV
jgi:hypothetical protein